jgi:hypothetical protein
MLAFFLTGWAALGGSCNEAKLAEGWTALQRAVQHLCPAPKEIDWVQYYKNGSNTSGVAAPFGPGRIQYAPVFVSPTLQWAVPNTCLTGPPATLPGYAGYGYPPK